MGVATTHGAAKVVKVLLDAGVDPNAACNQYGSVPLMNAARTDRASPALIKLLLAAMYGCGGVIDALVECGAKVNARTKSGKTALTLAKSNLTDRDTSGAVKALVKHGGTM